MKKIKLILSILVCVAIGQSASAQDELPENGGGTRFEKMARHLFENSDKTVMKYFISADGGLMAPSLGRVGSSGGFAKALSTKFEYGFARLTPLEDTKKSSYFASENIFLDLVSSFMMPRSVRQKGISNDSWRFGVGYRNGYTYNSTIDGKLTLFHGSTMSWTHFDTDIYMAAPGDTNDLKTFDEKLRFGSSFELGAIYRLNRSINFTLEYSHELVYPEFAMGRWFATSAVELLIQRGIDFFAYDFVVNYPQTGPLMVMAVKGLASAILATGRRDESYFPFGGARPMSFSGFRLKAAWWF